MHEHSGLRDHLACGRGRSSATTSLVGKLPKAAWQGLPGSPERSAHDSHDEPGEAENGKEGKEHNAGEAVLSAHDQHAPQVDEQAPAEYLYAYPEAAGSEGRLGSWGVASNPLVGFGGAPGDVMSVPEHEWHHADQRQQHGDPEPAEGGG